MALDPGNTPLIATLLATFDELAAPLNASIRLIWRGKDAPPEGKSILQNQLVLTAQRFINIRDCSETEKQRYYEELCRRFNLNCESNTFPLIDRAYLGPNSSNKTDRLPASVSYLQEYDQRHGTSYADKARAALFQFANLVIKSDGKVSPKEEAALLKYKEALYPDGLHLAPKPHQIEEEQSREITAAKEEPQRDIEDLLNELNSLVGLERVKSEVKQLVNFLKVQRMRQDKGMSTLPLSRHLVFYGNPGTGKTTVARLLAQIYRTLEILKLGHLIETDRSGLVAGYVGQTALKVKDVTGKALGGILFIDEAYSLSSGGGQDFGREAIETLLKMMEDHRHELVVVVAGYTARMDEFLSSNPGLRSRFNKFIHFDDFTKEQLVEIFKSFCKKSDFKLTTAAEEKLASVFDVLTIVRDETFGNARVARNLFEMTVSKQANRIVSLAEISEETLRTIEEADIPAADEIQMNAPETSFND